ncbi:MAG: SPFH domain-containing protein [Bauldia sp.]|nr:SPFH domain-containing protein [Bauldia sp.]MCW5718214.1 SPFH domain-containing protein [Bauldia sp.]
MIHERVLTARPGIPFTSAFIVLHLIGLTLIGIALPDENWVLIGVGVLINLLVAPLWIGLFMVAPNEVKVLQLFGAYAGTVRDPGLKWANIFFQKTKVSTRIRNFDSDRLKVNDLGGSPIEIGAVIVWQVVDTAEAVFEVDDYENFVRIQSEAALRGLAGRYYYDLGDEAEGVALRGHTDEVAAQLAQDVQARLDKAGVKVIEARISHLAYAPEIAGAMLQRQQAGAIIAARRRIVDGAVGMVEMALAQLAERGVVQLDEEKKAQMVSNLLVVLTSEKSTTPVINTGTLYG